ncbi:MAG: YihY/virulence factor BrkB family protein [Acidobacteriota bacterium]
MLFSTLSFRTGLFPGLPAWRRTLRYLMETEVHVYAFSMAANILLCFFPFFIVMVSICRYLLHWQAAEQAIYIALGDYFPDDRFGEFIIRNLKVVIAQRGPFQLVSVLLLLFTANGIFEPLEVALNRAWGITKNRSYLRNQLVSLGLILACGGLALLSTVLTAVNQELLVKLGIASESTAFVGAMMFKLAAVPISIVMLFSIYWLLPNAKIPVAPLLPVSLLVGAALEVLKNINLWTWPWLRAKLNHEYGPFMYSVTIILWGFLASMVVLAGAEWAARSREEAAEREGLQTVGAVD